MEEYKQITLDEWVQWKEDIRMKLAESANNFVHIGFRLKQIRDSGMFGGAADIFDFAQKEYGLGKSTVSRFIAINEKYSEGGNSLKLREEFRNFSSSKLAEMLTLTDSECQMITEKSTIKEIRDLKDFVRQQSEDEQEAAGLDGTAGVQQGQGHSPLQKCIIDFFRNKPDCLNKILLGMPKDYMDVKAAVELINPSGQSSHRKGIVYIVMYDMAGGLKYKQMGIAEPVSLTWAEFLAMVFEIYDADPEKTSDPYTAFYGIPSEMKEAEPVATSQQKKPADQETQQTGPRLSELESASETVEQTQEETEIEAAEQEPVMETAGQESEEEEAGRKMSEAEPEAEVEQAAAGQEEFSQEAAEYIHEEAEEIEDELLCDECANASALTGDVRACSNCGPEGNNYKPLAQEDEDETETPAETDDARIRELTKDIMDRFRHIQTEASFAERDRRKWIGVLVKLSRAEDTVNTLIRYLDKERGDRQ